MSRCINTSLLSNLDKWISCITTYFDSVRTLILVNGATTKEFTPAGGLRQGGLFFPPFI